MKRLLLALLVCVPLIQVRGDSIKEGPLSVTFDSLMPCDSVRLKIGFPNPVADPDTVMPLINALMVKYLTSDGQNWILFKPEGIDTMGTLAIDIIYYSAEVGVHVPGIWLNFPDTSSMQGSSLWNQARVDSILGMVSQVMTLTGGNLVTNYGFELGTVGSLPARWSLGYGTAGSALTSVVAARSGLKGMKVFRTGGNTQYVYGRHDWTRLEQGYYLVSVSAKIYQAAANDSGSILFQSPSNTTVAICRFGSSTWDRYPMTVYVPKDTTAKLLLGLSEGGSTADTAYFDDVMLIPIPNPIKQDTIITLATAVKAKTDKLEFDPSNHLEISQQTADGESLAVLSDSAHYQGSASGLTGEGVAHLVIDSMSSRGMIYDGGGNFIYAIYVLNAADSAAITGVTGTLYPDGGITLSVARRITGGNGILIYAIDTVAYDLYLHAPGYNYPSHYDYDIAGAGSDTIFLERFVPSPPPPNMTPIFAWLTTAGGDTINPSKLRYRPLKSDSAGDILYVYEGDSSYFREYTEDEKLNYGSGSNQVVIIKKWTEKSFTQSYLPINLYPNSLLSDTTSVYEFEATYRPQGGRDYIARHVIIEVPDTSAFNPFAE